MTDNLTDRFNVSLVIATTTFALLAALIFSAWHWKDQTFSIHSIRTPWREALYWLAILFTFTLGMGAGDSVAEKINIGY